MDLFQHEEFPLHEVKDVIGFWAARRLEPRWRDLAQMSLEYLSIPAISAEPERVFSGAKITISDQRCTLSDEAINASECLKSWERDGLISSHHEIQQLENTLDDLCRAEMERKIMFTMNSAAAYRGSN